MTVELGIGFVIMLALFVLWAHRMQKDEARQRQDRLDLKLKLINLEKLIGDEQRRAEAAEYRLRMGDSPTSQLIATLRQLEAPPTVFLNGQLLAPALDYTLSDDGIRFMFALRVRDVIQLHTPGERLVSILDQPVSEGDVVVITSTGVRTEEASEEAILEALSAAEQKLIEAPEPERTSRYDILARDDEEDP